MTVSFPHAHHPCWSAVRSDLWERIHLPIAKECNVQCNFCSNQISSCHSVGPGGCQRTMTPEEALATLTEEMERSENLHIVAISGPGEPLFNKETFVTLQKARELYPNIRMCLSTNGLLLSNSVSHLIAVGVDTVSVSMSAIRPETVRKLYSWAMVENKMVRGPELGHLIPEFQLAGIQAATENGINVKVNTVLIPSLNLQEIPNLSREIKKAGATLQNIIPLIPRGTMSDFPAPTRKVLNKMRESTERIIPQFNHCKQCRSDVVGIPGCDRTLT